MTPSSGMPGFLGLALRAVSTRGNGIDPSVEYTRRRSSFGMLFSEIRRDVEEEISLGFGRRANCVEDIVAAPAVRCQRLAFRFPARVSVTSVQVKIDIFPADAGHLIRLRLEYGCSESVSASLANQ